MDRTDFLIRRGFNSEWYHSAIPHRVYVDKKVNESVKASKKQARHNDFLDNLKALSFDKDQFTAEKLLGGYLGPIYQSVLGVWKSTDQDKFLPPDTLGEMILRRLIRDCNEWNLIPPQSQNTPAPKRSVASNTSVRHWLLHRRFGMGQTEELLPPTFVVLTGYIVDLTMVLERLSWIMFRRNLPIISADDVYLAFNEYIVSNARTDAHQYIRKYVGDPNPRNIDNALKVAKHLIVTYRSVQSIPAHTTTSTQKKYKRNSTSFRGA